MEPPDLPAPVRPPVPAETQAQSNHKPSPQTYAHLLDTLNSFLTIAIHSILYTRSLYPPTTFLLTRAYNYPVYQSRHPGVCKWINDAVISVIEQVGRGIVQRVAVVVYCDGFLDNNTERGEQSEGKGKEKEGGKGETKILERFIFDLSRFPHIPNKEDFHTEIERTPNGEEGSGKGLNMVDVEEQLRAAVGRLALVGGKLGKLPGGRNCTFGVVIELKDDDGGEGAPIGHPQPWIPSIPSLQPVKSATSTDNTTKSKSGAKTTPVRAVEAGEFIMEMWVEEGSAKFNDT